MSPANDPTPFAGPREFDVRVIQFLLPDGRAKECATPLTEDVKPHYEEMLASNNHFTAEMLRTGQISLTISGPDEDLMIEVVPNGPAVQGALENMLRKKPWEGQGTNDARK